MGPTSELRGTSCYVALGAKLKGVSSSYVRLSVSASGSTMT